MANYVYPAIGLIGGTAGFLDAIDGTNLADKDMAVVSVQGDKTYFYVLDVDSAAAEASPGIIAPDANGGDKRWILTGFTPVPAATGFTIAGGTTSKTLTVDETVAMSDKAPKASPVFTGDVKGTTANSLFASMNPTNVGVGHNGHSVQSTSLADNQSITVTMGGVSLLFTIGDNAVGNSAAFFAGYASSTIVKLADPVSYYAVTDSDLNPGIAVFKGTNSQVITIKNYTNAGVTLTVNCLGVVQAATIPA